MELVTIIMLLIIHHSIHRGFAISRCSANKKFLFNASPDEYSSMNRPPLIIGNHKKYENGDVTNLEDSISQYSTKSNMSSDSNCYLLYMLGRAWRTISKKLLPTTKYPPQSTIVRAICILI